jgi:hypothetical protein
LESKQNVIFYFTIFYFNYYRLVAAVIPELRPKDMGLGADKVALQKKNTDSKKEEEELKIEKGTFVKIIAGK